MIFDPVIVEDVDLTHLHPDEDPVAEHAMQLVLKVVSPLPTGKPAAKRIVTTLPIDLVEQIANGMLDIVADARRGQ